MATRQAPARGRVLAGTVLFVLGFAVVFTLLATLVANIGIALQTHQRTLDIVLGVLVIVLGLAFLGLVPGMQRELRINRLPAAGLVGAPIFGALFGLSWMPCTGPTLARGARRWPRPAAQTDRAVRARAGVQPRVWACRSCCSGCSSAGCSGCSGRSAATAGGSPGSAAVLLILVGIALVTGGWNDFLIWLLTTFDSTRGRCCDRRRGAPRPPAAPPPRRPNPVLALLRNSWRQLTSMRTALVLLFLLAVGGDPGLGVPAARGQRRDASPVLPSPSELAPLLDRLGGFECTRRPGSPPIYLLLFTSLVGCVVPRLVDHVRALRAVPPDAPQRLDRLPQHAARPSRADEPAAVAASVAAALRRRRFRTVVRERETAAGPCPPRRATSRRPATCCSTSRCSRCWSGWASGTGTAGTATACWCGRRPGLLQLAAAVRRILARPPGRRGRPADVLPQLTDFQAAYQRHRAAEVVPAPRVRSTGRTARPRPAVHGQRPAAAARRRTSTCSGHGYAPILRYTDRYGERRPRSCRSCRSTAC